MYHSLCIDLRQQVVCARYAYMLGVYVLLFGLIFVGTVIVCSSVKWLR